MITITDPYLLRWYGFPSHITEMSATYAVWMMLWRERYRWGKRK